MKQRAKGNVFLYLVLVFTFCTLTYFVHLGSLAAMWGPAVAAIISSLLKRRSLNEIGWRVRSDEMAGGRMAYSCRRFVFGVRLDLGGWSWHRSEPNVLTPRAPYSRNDFAIQRTRYCGGLRVHQHSRIAARNGRSDRRRNWLARISRPRACQMAELP